MRERDSKPASVLVIGTGHEYQRHQDTIEDRERVRAGFDRLLRRTIAERGVELIAEEAGDNEKVWDALQVDEAATPPEFRLLFGARKQWAARRTRLRRVSQARLVGG